MMGSTGWFMELFGIIPEGEIAEYNARVAKNMIREGLAPVLIRKNEKLPLCILKAADAKKANEAAQDAAKARGVVNWDSPNIKHDCGHKHALTAERQLTHTVIRGLLADGCNLGVSFEHSTKRVIVVDVDTDAERVGFLEACEGLDVDTPLTVMCPGVFDKKAEVWKHKDGGHMWFDVPEGVELPDSKGKARWCSCHGFNGMIVDEAASRRRARTPGWRTGGPGTCSCPRRCARRARTGSWAMCCPRRAG